MKIRRGAFQATLDTDQKLDHGVSVREGNAVCAIHERATHALSGIVCQLDLEEFRCDVARFDAVAEILTEFYYRLPIEIFCR